MKTAKQTLGQAQKKRTVGVTPKTGGEPEGSAQAEKPKGSSIGQKQI